MQVVHWQVTVAHCDVQFYVVPGIMMSSILRRKELQERDTTSSQYYGSLL